MDGDDYTWEGNDQGPVGSRMGERHVEAMERVVGLWPYPTVAAVGVLAEVLGFVKDSVRCQVSSVTGEGMPRQEWDWRREFEPLDPDGCYECDQ